MSLCSTFRGNGNDSRVVVGRSSSCFSNGAVVVRAMASLEYEQGKASLAIAYCCSIGRRKRRLSSSLAELKQSLLSLSNASPSDRSRRSRSFRGSGKSNEFSADPKCHNCRIEGLLPYA